MPLHRLNEREQFATLGRVRSLAAVSSTVKSRDVV
jgi:hypothetical protein